MKKTLLVILLLSFIKLYPNESYGYLGKKYAFGISTSSDYLFANKNIQRKFPPLTFSFEKVIDKKRTFGFKHKIVNNVYNEFPTNLYEKDLLIYDVNLKENIEFSLINAKINVLNQVSTFTYTKYFIYGNAIAPMGGFIRYNISYNQQKINSFSARFTDKKNTTTKEFYSDGKITNRWDYISIGAHIGNKIFFNDNLFFEFSGGINMPFLFKWKSVYNKVDFDKPEESIEHRGVYRFRRLEALVFEIGIGYYL